MRRAGVNESLAQSRLMILSSNSVSNINSAQACIFHVAAYRYENGYNRFDVRQKARDFVSGVPLRPAQKRATWFHVTFPTAETTGFVDRGLC